MPYAGQIDQVRGEYFNDGSATTEAELRFTLYLDGTTTTTTIGTTDRFVLTAVSSHNDLTGTTHKIFGGADENVGAGETLFVGRVGTATPFVFSVPPTACMVGTYPKLFFGGFGTAIDANIRGYIVRG
jgi:hypothetical protein